MTAQPTSRRSRVLAVVRALYLVVLAVALVAAIVSRRHEIAGLLDGTRPGWLAAALLLTFGQLWLSSVWWSSALTTLGSPATPRGVLAATVRSLPARYVPGSIWYPLGRAALLASEGVRKSALATVAALEAAISVVVAFSLGGLLLVGGGMVPRGAAAVAGVCVALLAAASPPVLNRALAWVAARRGILPPQLSWGGYARLLAWMVAFWSLSALSFSVYLQAFPDIALRAPLTVAGAYLVSWGIGFLAVFAPQGLGVFEVTLAALLTGRPAAGLAVVIAGFRALVAVRDALAFTAGALGRGAWRRSTERD